MKPNNFKSRLLISASFFTLVCVSVFFGFTFLRKYSSESFLISKSVENIIQESEKSTKTKDLVLENSDLIKSLDIHIIRNEEEIPLIVEEIEGYSNDTLVDTTISNISLIAPNAKDKKPGDKIYIDLRANGGFGNLYKLIKMLENGKYVFSVENYSLRQVIVAPPKTLGGEPVFIEINRASPNTVEEQTKTWLLDIKLSTAIYKE